MIHQGKAMAMKLLMIMPKLLLQKEHMKAKKKENDKAFRRRMEAWQKGEYLELMEEAEAIQKRLRQQPRVETEGMIARKFRTRMEEGNVHQAARLLQPQQGGLLQINKETTEKLKKNAQQELGPLKKHSCLEKLKLHTQSHSATSTKRW